MENKDVQMNKDTILRLYFNSGQKYAASELLDKLEKEAGGDALSCMRKVKKLMPVILEMTKCNLINSLERAVVICRKSSEDQIQEIVGKINERYQEQATMFLGRLFNDAVDNHRHKKEVYLDMLSIVLDLFPRQDAWDVFQSFLKISDYGKKNSSAAFQVLLLSSNAQEREINLRALERQSQKANDSNQGVGQLINPSLFQQLSDLDNGVSTPGVCPETLVSKIVSKLPKSFQEQGQELLSDASKAVASESLVSFLTDIKNAVPQYREAAGGNPKEAFSRFAERVDYTLKVYQELPEERIRPLLRLFDVDVRDDVRGIVDSVRGGKASPLTQKIWIDTFVQALEATESSERMVTFKQMAHLFELGRPLAIASVIGNVGNMGCPYQEIIRQLLKRYEGIAPSDDRAVNALIDTDLKTLYFALECNPNKVIQTIIKFCCEPLRSSPGEKKSGSGLQRGGARGAERRRQPPPPFNPHS